MTLRERFRPLTGIMFRNPVPANPHSHAAERTKIGAD